MKIKEVKVIHRIAQTSRQKEARIRDNALLFSNDFKGSI